MSKHIDKLRARLKEIVGALDTFEAKENPTEEEISKVKELTEEAARIEDQVATLEASEKIRARAAEPANTPANTDRATDVQPNKKLEPKEKIGLIVCGMMHAKANEGAGGARATFRALDEMGYGEVAREFEAAQHRTLNSANASAGGVLLPENMADDMIDILRPNTTFLQGNPIDTPMPNGTFKQSAAASGASAAYRGETSAIAVSNPTFRAINMSAKLLGGIVPVSNQLIRWSLPKVAQWVERDLSSAMGTRMDLAAFRGDGLQDTPLGITNIAGVLRQDCASATGATPTAAQVEADAKVLELQMENNNLPLLGVEWRMAPRTFKYLQDMRDGNSNSIYPSLSLPNPMWRGYPVRKTTQIPTNLGVGTDASEIYLVAFGHVLFGNAMSMQLAISDVATVVNGAQTINSFQDGVTVVKAEMEHDFDIRYTQAVCVLTAVKWGS